MNQISIIISNGSDFLENTKNKYQQDIIDYKEKLEMLNITNELMGLSKTKDVINLEEKINSLESYEKYIQYIQNELNKIRLFKEEEHNEDYIGNSLYFGNGTFYYSNKFLNYSNDQIFQIILNHIFNYSGMLYLIKSKENRLSYILGNFFICYGKSIKKLSSNFHTKNNKNEFIVLDINHNYKNFIDRNIDYMGFIETIIYYKNESWNKDKLSSHFDKYKKIKDKIYKTHCITLNKTIKFKSIELNYVDNKIIKFIENKYI